MIAACLKWADPRPDVDPLTGGVHTDARSSGASEADLAALEWALRMAETWDDEVVAVTAGPPDADAVLRVALAAGATTAIRADLPCDAPSEAVAAAIAGALGSRQAVASAVPGAGHLAVASAGAGQPAVASAGHPTVVVCGAWSIDRGSGSVPAYLAAHLGAAQALGLVTLTIDADAPVLWAERRLDGGRRERLRVPAPAVVSVEGGSARLRRAPLGGVLRAGEATIDVRATLPVRRHDRPVRVAPFRPRPRPLAAPVGATARERVLALTGAMVERRAAQTLFLEPADAAREIVDHLRAWGYLP